MTTPGTTSEHTLRGMEIRAGLHPCSARPAIYLALAARVNINHGEFFPARRRDARAARYDAPPARRVHLF
ncbi:hypothetical protein EVAR_37717_1 [Eumeta japonica]|uniref:Uncharacterized protein n=1 Tax=Eumeta variegata TaxID=151549 RepID=A0A4C1YNL8_EUMVA|nr:hypothetical protein EVAR_37717_1 [Eumeta japonica]